MLLLFNYFIRSSNFHIVRREAKGPGTVSRLERPGNFSGPKTNFKIKTCWILAEFLAHKPVSFALLTDSSIVSFLKSLKRWSWICKHGERKPAFWARTVTGTFYKTGPRIENKVITVNTPDAKHFNS